MEAKVTKCQLRSGRETIPQENGCSRSVRAPIGSQILRLLLVLVVGVTSVLTDN